MGQTGKSNTTRIVDIKKLLLIFWCDNGNILMFLRKEIIPLRHILKHLWMK